MLAFCISPLRKLAISFYDVEVALMKKSIIIIISAIALLGCSKSQRDSRYPASLPVGISLYDFCDELNYYPDFEGVVQEPIWDFADEAQIPVLFSDGSVDTLFVELQDNLVTTVFKLDGDNVLVEYN